MPLNIPCLAPCEAGHFTFFLHSDALTCVNIPDGSRLLACPATNARTGDLVIADTPVGKLVRYYRMSDHGICLDARNPSVPPLILPPETVEVLGVICALLA